MKKFEISFVILAVVVVAFAAITGCAAQSDGAGSAAPSHPFGEGAIGTCVEPGAYAPASPGSKPVITRFTDGQSNLLGYTVTLSVPSRSAPFEIMAALAPDGCVRQAMVLRYPAVRGRDVTRPAFTSQFTGKCATDRLKIGYDIDAMTGATISSKAMTKGVKYTIALIKDININQN